MAREPNPPPKDAVKPPPPPPPPPKRLGRIELEIVVKHPPKQ